MPDSVEEYVGRENIRRLECQIAQATDDRERALLLVLLRAEKDRIEAIRPRCT
jgi:hypothetical protein